MRVAEIYRSVQGEGLLAGTPSAFLRVSGCNLRCWFCDTPYASWHPEGDDLAPDDILAQLEPLGLEHVVITGGEPLLFAELVPLCHALRDRQKHVTIETAGTLHLPLACNLMSISPKLANSAPQQATHAQWYRRHEQTRHMPHVIRQLIREHVYQFKFVVDQPHDLPEVASYLLEFPEIDRSRVMLMPQGTTLGQLAATAEWLEPACAELGYRFCPRYQIEWFGLSRGT